MKEVAIYHYTDRSEKRPRVCERQMDELRKYADRPGWHVRDVFCDMSVRKSGHPEFERFLEHCGDYDVLVTKDFYHIQYHTRSCLDLMGQIREQGVEIHSVENGTFMFSAPPLEKKLRVATYFGRAKEYKSVMVDIQNDIYRHFVREKTNWEITGMYTDRLAWREEHEQKELQRLIADRDEYDLVLVNHLGAIHWRTAMFCTVREQLKKDIYSLRDGFLGYQKEEG